MSQAYSIEYESTEQSARDIVQILRNKHVSLRVDDIDGATALISAPTLGIDEVRTGFELLIERGEGCEKSQIDGLSVMAMIQRHDCTIVGMGEESQ